MHNDVTFRNRNGFLYLHLQKKEQMITEQTWYNLRVEYIDELTFQFGLREKLEKLNPGTAEYKRIEFLLKKSCERCRNYDYLIQENANKIIN